MSRASCDIITVPKIMSQSHSSKKFLLLFCFVSCFKLESREWDGKSPETLGRGRTSDTPLLRLWKTLGPRQSVCEDLSSLKVTWSLNASHWSTEVWRRAWPGLTNSLSLLQGFSALRGTATCYNTHCPSHRSCFPRLSRQQTLRILLNKNSRSLIGNKFHSFLMLTFLSNNGTTFQNWRRKTANTQS